MCCSYETVDVRYKENRSAKSVVMAAGTEHPEPLVSSSSSCLGRSFSLMVKVTSPYFVPGQQTFSFSWASTEVPNSSKSAFSR